MNFKNNEHKKKILVTGSKGFIGKNFIVKLKELSTFTILEFNRDDSLDSLSNLVSKSDIVIHLLAENRPTNIKDYYLVNTEITKKICDTIKNVKKNIPIIFTSSIQAGLNNDYGKSKLQAEEAIKLFIKDTEYSAVIYRLPGVFGKWCKPNYNSVVATFCFNTINDLPLEIDDKEKEMRLIYIDDLIHDLLNTLANIKKGLVWASVKSEYLIKIGKLATIIQSFKISRKNLIVESFGFGITKLLYATYLSYLEPKFFSYNIPVYKDERGIFSEIIKTNSSGQFSYFTINQNKVRGGHYHNSKTEKFLIIKGSACFRFKHAISKTIYEINVSEENLQIIDTVPGWIHNIINIGDGEVVGIVWANEIFDHRKPDTISGV